MSLLLPLVLAPAALDSQFPCLCRPHASPQGVASTYSASVLCDTRLAAVRRGPASVSWAGTLTRSCPGQSAPRARRGSPSVHGPRSSSVPCLRHPEARGGLGLLLLAVRGGQRPQDPTLAKQGRRVPASSLTGLHRGSGGTRARARRVLCRRPAVVRTGLSRESAAGQGSLRGHTAVPLDMLSGVPGGIAQSMLQPHVLYEHQAESKRFQALAGTTF